MLEDFLSAILVIYDNINKDKEAPRKSAINNTIIDKQYLAYYLYRIWIKQRKLMENVNSNAEFDEVLNYLEIPVQYQDMNLVYPMVNKMTINEKQLDLVILSILRHLNKAVKIYGKDPKPPADFKLLQEYTKGKTIENIIQDIIQIKLLVPNLSRPANVHNIWNDLEELFDSLELTEMKTEEPTPVSTNIAPRLSSMNVSKPASSMNMPPASLNMPPASTNVPPASTNVPPASTNMPKPASSNVPKPASTNMPKRASSTNMPDNLPEDDLDDD